MIRLNNALDAIKVINQSLACRHKCLITKEFCNYQRAPNPSCGVLGGQPIPLHRDIQAEIAIRKPRTGSKHPLHESTEVND